MKNHSIFRLFILLCLMWTGPVALHLAAQTSLVRHYTINDGLSNNAVYSITQDDKGRMWLGTIDGLHSFDGNEIRVWRDTSSVAPGPTIYTIREDNQSRLWVGSDRGLSLFDLKQERYVPLECNNTPHGTVIKTAVSSLLRDDKGRMWIATFGQGIFRYDPKEEKMEEYNLGRLNTEYVIGLMKDHEGTVWAASRSEGISRYDAGKDRFVYVNGGKEEAFISLFEDSSHRLWAGSNRHGLYELDRETGALQLRLRPEGEVMQVRSIVEHKPGVLLLASDEGLTRYCPGTEERQTLKAQLNHPHALNDSYLQTLYFDREGALWVGTYFGGVNYFSPEGDNFVHYRRQESGLTARIISVMAQAEGNNLWIGSDDNGFFHWDRQTNQYRHFMPQGKRPFSPTYHNIHALMQDGDKLYVGMYMGGLDIIDLKSGAVRNYMPSTSSQSLYATGIYAIYRDLRGEVWIGTTLGLNRYLPATDNFERVFMTHLADISCITDDARNNLWVCSSNKGLFRLDRTTDRWYHYSAEEADAADHGLPTNRIFTASTDEAGALWLGTDGEGLLCFDYKSQRFQQVNLGHRVRVIYKIIPYKHKLWLTTNQGLYLYDTDTQQLSLFNKEDGLQENAFLPNSGLIQPDGTIFIGGINGFNQFNPNRMIYSAAASPQVIISNFQLFNQPVQVGGERSPLEQSITYSDELTLRHEHNIFSLQVAMLSYINPSKNLYRYRLDGLEKVWTESDAAPHVSYTNLRPGRYTFRVSVSTGNGQWTEDALRLSIRVLPPWWFSPLALVSYLLLFFLGLFLLYWRLVQRQRERLRLMAIEKDREVYQSKIDFFTLMIHELRTPLTLILGPLRQVLKEGGSVEEARPQLEMAERNGQRLTDVVNQLMDFRKSESGEMFIHMGCVELKGVLTAIVQRFEWMARSRNVQLLTEMPEGECLASTDAEAFNKMVSNLLSNALKFASSRIVIALTPASEGERWELRVSDDGIGIAPENQEKIFNAFYQVKANRPQDYIGTGIGLALVKRLVAVTGATIRIESEVGHGTSFIVSLPKGERQSAECYSAEPQFTEPQFTEPQSVGCLTEQSREEGVRTEYNEEKAACGRQPNLRTEGTVTAQDRILVVEDNDDMLRFLQGILSSRYEVRCATNGSEALSVMEQWQPELVLSDIMMPVMDGMELCRRLKSSLSTSHIAVVLLSAKSNPTSQVEGLEYGADLYLSKPFTPEVMLAQIGSLLHNRALLRQRYRNEPLTLPELTTPGSGIDRDFMQRVDATIEERLTDDSFNVEQLAQAVGVSRTALFTKTKALIGLTPNDYIRLIRLKKAAALLAGGGVSVSEACYQAGFSSTSYFSKCFQNQFGMTPGEFKQSRGAASGK